MTDSDVCGVNNSLSLFILNLTAMAQFESLENFAEIIENEGHTAQAHEEEKVEPHDEVDGDDETEADGDDETEADEAAEETEEEKEA